MIPQVALIGATVACALTDHSGFAVFFAICFFLTMMG